MIRFKEKVYSEYDAMRQLYVEMGKRYRGNDGKPGFKVISPQYLPGILKGNSVVIEKFVIVSRMIGNDKYRMYIKLGSKIKLPDKVKLPSLDKDTRNLGSLNTTLYPGLPIIRSVNKTVNSNTSLNQSNKTDNKGGKSYTVDELRNLGLIKGNPSQRNNSDMEERLYDDKNDNKSPKFGFVQNISVRKDLSISSDKPLGSTILYDKSSRSLVLEFNSIRDAVESLNYLPLGLSYDLYIVS